MEWTRSETRHGSALRGSALHSPKVAQTEKTNDKMKAMFHLC